MQGAEEPVPLEGGDAASVGHTLAPDVQLLHLPPEPSEYLGEANHHHPQHQQQQDDQLRVAPPASSAPAAVGEASSGGATADGGAAQQDDADKGEGEGDISAGGPATIESESHTEDIPSTMRGGDDGQGPNAEDEQTKMTMKMKMKDDAEEGGEGGTGQEGQERKEGQEGQEGEGLEELRDAITGRWTITVANVNKTWSTEQVERHLQRNVPFWADLHCEVILMQHKNLSGLKNRGVAHLELSSGAEAARLHRYLIESEFALGDAPLRVDWRRPERHDESLRSVYVANAPVAITKAEVRNLFSKFGDIEFIFLSSELPKKQRRDWMVITFATRESAIEAIRTMHGHLLNGYKMVLTFYVQSDKGNRNPEPPAPSPGTRASKKARYDFYCEKCDVVCQSAEKLHEHLAGKKHQTFRPSDSTNTKSEGGKESPSSRTHQHNRPHKSNEDGRGRRGPELRHDNSRRGGGHDNNSWDKGHRKRGRDADDSGQGGRRDYRSPSSSRYRESNDRWQNTRGNRDGGWSAAQQLPLNPAIMAGHVLPQQSALSALLQSTQPVQRCQLCDGFGHTAKECPSFARSAQPPIMSYVPPVMTSPQGHISLPTSFTPTGPSYSASPSQYRLGTTIAIQPTMATPSYPSMVATSPYGGMYAPGGSYPAASSIYPTSTTPSAATYQHPSYAQAYSTPTVSAPAVAYGPYSRPATGSSNRL